MKQLLIHIGYPKTATTFLQHIVFEPELFQFHSPFNRWDTTKLFVLPHPLKFNVNATRNVLLPSIENTTRKDMLPVISNEILSGQVFAGGRDSKEIAQRLKAVFGESKIFLSIREQKSMIGSIYKEFLLLNGSYPLKRFLNTGEQQRLAAFHMDHFLYHNIIKLYAELFEQDNVLVLPYELLKQDPETYFQRFLNFCGRTYQLEDLTRLAKSPWIHQSFSGYDLLAKRLVNRFIGSYDTLNRQPLISLPSTYQRYSFAILRRLLRLLPDQMHKNYDDNFKRTIEDHVGNYFKESNRLTSELIGYDLSEFGYDT